MVKQTAPLELLVDTHKYSYGFDAAALVKIDAEDPAAGAFYGLRAVGWPSGMAVRHGSVSRTSPPHPLCTP